MEGSNPNPQSISPQPMWEPKTKPRSKKTKADIETELADARAEIARLKTYATEFVEAKSALDEKHTILRNQRQKLEEREALLEWGFEQQEAVLNEAVSQGIELSHAVLEQKYLLERDIAEKWSQACDSSRQGDKRPS